MTEIAGSTDTALAPLLMIVVHDWAAIPFFMMIWLAGLATFSPELASRRIWTARAIRTFWHIELPQLRGTAVLVCALSSIGAFQTFTLQYVLSTDPGGPVNSTLVLGLLVFKEGFQYFRMGYAAAISVVMFLMILAVTLVQIGSAAMRVARAHGSRRWVWFVPALVLAIIFAFPLWFMVTSAFKAETEIKAVPMHWLPHDFQGLAQFRDAADFAPIVALSLQQHCCCRWCRSR